MAEEKKMKRKENVTVLKNVVKNRCLMFQDGVGNNILLLFILKKFNFIIIITVILLVKKKKMMRLFTYFS